MSVYMIGTVSRNFDQKVGIRLYDTKTNEYKDCPIGGILSYLESGNEVQNLTIKDGVAFCTNGTFDRYATVVLNIGVAGRSPLVIVKEYADGTYDVVNGQGECARMGMQYLLRYDKTDGIANGRVVPLENGQATIIPFTDGAEFEHEKVISAEAKIKRMSRRMNLVGESAISIENGVFTLVGEVGEKVIIPDGAVEIGGQAFLRYGKNVTDVKIPNSVKIVRQHGFAGTMKLKEVHLNVGLEVIESQAFDNSGITTVYLPPTVREIQKFGFKGVRKIVFYNRAQKSLIDDAVGFQAVRVQLMPWKGKV